jgi:peptidoglycan/LPS O-acetylase OafA/YrhL
MQYSSFSADSGNLDLIRACAVLCVFFAHLHDIVTGRATLVGWHLAQIGVLTFFVHTSMVLMLSLERMRLAGKQMFLAFYLRRFFRLYPLSMFCVTLAMLLHRAPIATHSLRYWTWWEYLVNLALANNLTYTDTMVGGLWTLPLEVQMYVLLPALYLLVRSRGPAALGLLWILSVPLAVAQGHISERISVLAYAPCFIAGVLAYGIAQRWPRRSPGWLWPVVFPATWCVFFLARHGADMPYRWAFCLTLGCAIPWFREIPSGLMRRAAAIVAKYSYGIYLSHVALMIWAFNLPVTPLARWAVFIVSAIAVPVAMFYCIERPLMQTGKLLSDRMFRSRISEMDDLMPVPSASSAFQRP